MSKFLFAILSALVLATESFAREPEALPLWKIQQTLAGKRFVDLTHAFEPGSPHWPGFPDETRKTIYWYDKQPGALGAGFFAELFTHVGQWGCLW
jgi:hypothetical protein